MILIPIHKIWSKSVKVIGFNNLLMENESALTKKINEPIAVKNHINGSVGKSVAKPPGNSISIEKGINKKNK
jgi:hypothetical protein